MKFGWTEVFISQKLHPKDIDAVFLLDHTIVSLKKSVLGNQWFSPAQKLNFGLDLYYSIEYPKDHNRYFLSHLNHLYWKDIYGHTRVDSFGKQYKKGFLTIKFS